MEYNVDYFIRKFEAIPESEIGYCQNSGCAYGQCRRKEIAHDDGSHSPEGLALESLMMQLLPLTPSKTALWHPAEGTPARINNGDVAEYQQPTPKQRVLAALRDLKSKQVKERIVYVTVDEKVRELQKKCDALN